jgi:hypothetical protein
MLFKNHWQGEIVFFLFQRITSEVRFEGKNYYQFENNNKTNPQPLNATSPQPLNATSPQPLNATSPQPPNARYLKNFLHEQGGEEQHEREEQH